MAEDIGFNALAAALGSCGIDFAAPPADLRTVPRVADELALPPELAQLYALSGPAPRSAIPWTVDELRVFSIDELSDALEGYSWSGPRREPLPGWSGNWVVVASVAGDAFFADVSQPGPPVFYVSHGAGTWRPSRVAPSMTVFIQTLVMFELVLMRDFGGDPWQDDGLAPGFLPALHAGLSELLNPADLANFLESLA